MDAFKKKIVLIGVGNCGCQNVNRALKLYPEIFDGVCVNTSDADLAMVEQSILKFKIGEDIIEGSGKNRTKMKKYLKEDIKTILFNEEFQSSIADKKYAFVIVSAAGGTGSGAGPVLLDVLKGAFTDVHFVLVGVLPRLGASLMEQGNTLEFLDELYKTLGEDTTYMIYDNETTSDLSPTESLIAVNDAIVEDIRILSGIDNHPTSFDSIDDADMESIITTPGRLLVTRIKKGLTEKILEDNDINDIIIKEIKRSCNAETNRDRISVRWGIITHLTDIVNKLYSSNLSKLEEFIGTPHETFNHNAVNNKNELLNFLYFVASGLSPINDRVRKINDRIDELKEALASAKAGQYVGEENPAYDVMAERKKQERKAAQEGSFNVTDIFRKFQS